MYTNTNAADNKNMAEVANTPRKIVLVNLVIVFVFFVINVN
jgi:hypothetical protein